IGINDNFFELGGHSLLATRLVSKIRSRFTVDLPLKVVFEGGSVAQLADRIATAERQAGPAIVPIDRTQYDRLPLSFAQERLWFLNELAPDTAGYNIPGAIRIRGAVDIAQVEEAFHFLIARHETLRTVFPSEDGQARQKILEAVDFRLQRIDLTGWDGEVRDAEAKRLCQSEAATPFDLAAGPLLRGLVIRLAGDEHILMLTLHHIISDGWSHGVLIRELGAVMAALSEGRRPELPPLPIQYADYSVWQRRWLKDGGALERQLGYWQQKLAGAPESLDLPTDHPRPGVQSFEGASYTVALDAQLTARLKGIAEEQGGTLYMVLLAAFQALLHRYTGQDDICVGSPIANRQYGETEGLIGMFVNTLALRTRVESGDSFADLLARVKTTCLEAYEHQDAPFEKVVDVLQLRRDLAVNPLFQVMLVLQNADPGFIADDRIRPFPLDNGISKFDLTLTLTETPDGLAGSLQYRAALFERQTIGRMVEHFRAVCRAITATPSARVSELEILDATEKRRLLVDFNDTRAEVRADASLQKLLAEQAALRPQQPAVVFGEQELTYEELHRKSSQLASYLRSKGVQADSRVGLYTGRSLEMVVGLFGILQAGGAYVPLDPDYPADRLQYMLEDAAPTIVLTQQALAERLPQTAAPAIALDTQWSAIEEHARTSGHGVTVETNPDHLAYVIYTSGSTGAPKGVMVRQGGVVNLREALERAIYAGHDDWTRVSVNAS
ncbi:MAG TPA: condensation domain-containing protein, partial [Thermoanaerobaculia bacterium]